MERPVLRPQMTADRLDRFAEAWLRGDVNELRSYLAADVVYSPLSGELVRGREAVVRRFAALLRRNDDSALHFERSTVSGSLGSCRWRLAGRTPDGAAFEIEGVDLYTFEGDLIRFKD